MKQLNMTEVHELAGGWTIEYVGQEFDDPLL